MHIPRNYLMWSCRDLAKLRHAVRCTNACDDVLVCAPDYDWFDFGSQFRDFFHLNYGTFSVRRHAHSSELPDVVL